MTEDEITTSLNNGARLFEGLLSRGAGDAMDAIESLDVDQLQDIALSRVYAEKQRECMASAPSAGEALTNFSDWQQS